MPVADEWQDTCDHIYIILKISKNLETVKCSTQVAARRLTLKEVVEAGRFFAESSQVFPRCHSVHISCTTYRRSFKRNIQKEGEGSWMVTVLGDLALLFHWMLWTLSLRSFARVGCTV